MNAKQKVYVGMSGGVDSSVSAALLKEQGYDVTGVFIKVWQPDFMPCSWKEERLDAKRVAAHLNIPFITLDLEEEYKKEVVDYMIDEYKKGNTPNPDVMCNRYVKFGGFYEWAMGEGADFVATGHYARVEKNKSTPSAPGTFSVRETRPEPLRRGPALTTKAQDASALQQATSNNLLKGRDDNKDQSYFLWTLTEEKLKHVLFPVGDIPKPEVRKLAKKFKLPNAEKKDSQGLCFVGKIDMKEFLKHFIDEKSGDVLNESGEIIGHHEGALFYTLGERHGFVITKKTPDDKPYYVAAKDSIKNTLTVTNKIKVTTNQSNLERKPTLLLINTNWIGAFPAKEKTYKARIRYRGVLHNVKTELLKDKKADISFVDGGEDVSSGQSVVLYEGERCVGGGIID